MGLGEATLKMILLGEDRSASRAMRGVGDEAEHTGSRMHTFGKVAAGAALGLAGAATAAGAAAVEFGKKSVDAYKDAAAESGLLARVTGMTIEQASQLRFAGEETGVQFTTLAKGMQMFGKNLGTAAGDSKKAAAMVDTLGFSFRNAHGQVRPMATLLPELADRFAKMPDGPAKTALAMKLFGKGGADMIKTLNKGSEGLKELADESDKTGNTLKNTDAYKAQLVAQREFHASITGLKVQVGQALMPVLASLSMFMAHDVGPAFQVATGWVHQHGDTIRQVFSTLIATVKGPVMGIVNLIRQNWSGIKAWTQTTMVQIRAVVQSALQLIQAIWARFGNNILAYVKTVWHTVGGVISGGLKVIQGLINVFSGLLTGNWSKVWKGLGQILGGAWKVIISMLSGALGVMRNAVSAGLKLLLTIFSGLGKSILHGLGNLNMLLFNAGKQIIQGLLNGLGSMASAVANKAKSIASGAVSAVKGALGIHSPSRVFSEIGVNMLEGLVQGIDKGKVRLSTVMGKLTDYIKAEGAKIQGLLQAQAGVVSTMQGFASSVFSASFTDANGNATQGSISDLLGFQQNQLAQAQQTRSDVAAVTKMGLSRNLLQQFLNSGSAGLANLHTLAGGTSADISRFNSLNAQTNADYAAAGTRIGNSLYGAQLAQAQQNKAVADALEHGLEKWSHLNDKNTVVQIHLEGRTIQMSLLQLKRKNGGKALGLT